MLCIYKFMYWAEKINKFTGKKYTQNRSFLFVGIVSKHLKFDTQILLLVLKQNNVK